MNDDTYSLSLATGNVLHARAKPDDLCIKCLTLHSVNIIVTHLTCFTNMAITEISP